MWLIILVAGVLIFPSAMVYGQEERVSVAAETVVLSYEQALQMALRGLLSISDMDVQLREMQRQHEDMWNDLRRLERGGYTWERINDLHKELSALDIQAWNLVAAQMEMRQGAESALEDFFSSVLPLDDEGSASPSIQSLQAAIQGMIGAHDLNNSLAMMEMRHNSISQEIQDLQNGTRMQERIAEARGDLADLERAMKNIRFQQEQTKLGSERTLRNLIIVSAELSLSVETEKANLTLTEENLNRARVRFELGLASANELRLAEQSLAQARMDLNTLLINQANAQQNLNHLLGATLPQFTVIEFEREIIELPENLTMHIIGAITQSPTIRQLQLDVDRAREEQRAYTGFDRDTIRTLREAYERAVLGRDQAKGAMEAAMRRGFNDLDNLLIQNRSLGIELENASLALEAILLNFQLGRATQHDVAQVRLNIYRIEQRIEANQNSKWTQSFLLENPSLLG